MLKKLAFCFTLWTLLFGRGAYGQSKKIDCNFNGWYFMIHNFKLSPSWSAGNELHFRRAGVMESWQQFLFRPSLNDYLTHQVVAILGYTYIRTYPYGGQSVPTVTPENNLWQQLELSRAAGKVAFHHHYRLVERWIGVAVRENNGPYAIEGTKYRQRFRYRLTAKVPLYTIEGGIAKLFLVIFDEIWFPLEDNFQPCNLDQHWLYAAIGYQFNPRGNLPAGLMDQYLGKGDEAHYDNDATLQAGLFYKMNFSH